LLDFRQQSSSAFTKPANYGNIPSWRASGWLWFDAVDAHCLHTDDNPLYLFSLSSHNASKFADLK
jgi:hypothetical protein